ncbi:Rhodanese-related sulfurtransferase [hydrothermal vent metagenome]|uniref:Rhodanese-related sulfurtransferase n=1 Tax=hydrothermal vent metagenome TaxID=652676 RepID=A0A3B0Y882_9ZZZZ
MKTFEALVREALDSVEEIFPWDLAKAREDKPELVLLDVREPYEYHAMHIKDALNVPRGILETACEFNYEETVPELANAREQEIIVICRSGKRSVLVAQVMQQLGYRNVKSLKTGMRGWSDDDQDMVDRDGKPVSEDAAIEYFTPRLRPEQMNK